MLAAASQELSDDEAGRDKLLHCGTPQADPGCQVEQRFLFQVLRGRAKELVFTEMLAGFLLSGADPSLVPPNPHMLGLNLVMPEDWYVPMKDFPLQMRMLAYLHERYPKVHISLHAGELVQGLVPPEGLRFHIRDSIEIAHAERIGHGVDVMNETNPEQLLREMADDNIMVEICLTSNAVILDVSGPRHPLSEYLRAGVPVALATDDEGVARSDMTHEYLRGAEDQKLTYLQLKKMARTGVEHAFVPGGKPAARRQELRHGEGVRQRCSRGKAEHRRLPEVCERQREGAIAVGAGRTVPGIRTAAMAACVHAGSKPPGCSLRLNDSSVPQAQWAWAMVSRSALPRS